MWRAHGGDSAVSERLFDNGVDVWNALFLQTVCPRMLNRRVGPADVSKGLFLDHLKRTNTGNRRRRNGVESARDKGEAHRRDLCTAE